jgi:hypothetical protein
MQDVAGLAWNNSADGLRGAEGVTEFRFISPCPRTPMLPGLEDSCVVAPNNEFPLYVYKPPHFDSAQYKHVILMVNGFDEPHSDLKLYYNDSCSFSRILNPDPATLSSEDKPFFSKTAFAFILVPIPFHYWRLPCAEAQPEHSVGELMKRHPQRLYLGFRQLMYDMLMLIDVLAGIRRMPSFTSSVFAEDDEVAFHVMGYSLGGLGALALFLCDRLLGRRVLHTCTLIASLLTMDQVTADHGVVADKHHRRRRVVFRTAFSKELLRAIGREYFAVSYPGLWKKHIDQHIPYALEHDPLLMDLFDRVVLDIQDYLDLQYIDDCWRSVNHRINYIFCSEDQIASEDDVRIALPHDVRREIREHSICHVDHEIAKSETWHHIAQEEGKLFARMIVDAMR